MSSTMYLIIGIVLALAGFGMLFAAMASSPVLKKNREKLRKKAAEHHHPEEG
ncbi:hypothetical protein [Brevibacillus brevis]|uniref:Uncharacterized protein n=1 Tax=Brevibacillus brevis TaxID=1393 RepID=A0ABY9T0M8_BREBE|nr:hypothetical protein [Brevibacillus brevis]WNC13399.1 hypothetical protein RGB73_22270 [Brevibacillus brevis]